jgi:hypothetical protein
MAKMSQKELLEEGFSDKIRGIAKAVKTGVKQAAQQGVNLDTGTLTTGMYDAYKDEQPVAFLKKALANDKDIGIVKIDKSNIKKQQASGKKGYLGRIVGPKTVTLIPFEGTLYNKKERRYEGPGAGASPPPDAVNAELKNEAAGDSVKRPGGPERAVEGKPMPDCGSVTKCTYEAAIRGGVKKGLAEKLATWLRGHVGDFLRYVKETHPDIEFSYKENPKSGIVDYPDKEMKFPKAGGVAEGPTVQEIQDNPPKTKKLVVPEGFSLRDIIQLSREIFIVEANEKRNELRRRAAKLGIEGRSKMKIGELEAAIAEAEAAKKAKEADPTGALPEYYKEKPAKKKAPAKKKTAKKKTAKKKTGWKEVVRGLDKEVIFELLKSLQESQKGYRVKIGLRASDEYKERKEKEETGPKSDYQGETGMFVAEIFRTKKGLQLGDIYRQEDPTDVVRGEQQSKSKEEVKLSPFDKAVETLKTKNNLTAATLAPALKIDKVNVITDITKKDVGVKLLDTDIEKIKAVLIKDGVIKEGTSQKVLLRQLTSLSR